MRQVHLANLPEAVTQQNIVFIFDHPDWHLRMEILTTLLGKSKIPSHYDCSTFPSMKRVEESCTLEELQKKRYPAYVTDYDIAQCEALWKWIQPLLSHLDSLQSCGKGDLLRFLQSLLKPTVPPFLRDDKDYAYVNCYLYIGGKGTGTPLHYVRFVFGIAKDTRIVTPDDS